MSTDRPERRRFGPVRADASEQIANELRLYVDRAGLRPGDRIGTEIELAREFQVSRATLREAVRLLAGSHLIRSTQGRSGGIFVANTLQGSMGENMSQVVAAMIANQSMSLRTMLEMRTVLEVAAAGLAAERADDAAVEALAATVETMKKRPTLDEEFGKSDIAFHQIIADAAGNDLLVAFTSWTLDVLVPTLVERLRPTMDVGDLINQHAAILRAIRRRQPAAAQRSMKVHMDYLSDMLLQLVPASEVVVADASTRPLAAERLRSAANSKSA